MTLRRSRLSLAMLVSGIALLAVAAIHSGADASSGIKDGGTFRVSLGVTIFDYVDPALSYTGAGWALLDTTCARLMNYPDKPPPAGLRVEPEVAARYPRISNDAKTYTFAIREGFRFSDGTPVRADAFARAINRTLAQGIKSPGAQYTGAIVGAGAVQEGKSAAAAGVVASGNRLVIRFTRPVPDFPAQTTMPFFCAVPPTLPSDPEGVGAFPGAGPYYISEYVRGQRAVLERNRFYRGTRPHHVDRFVVDLRARTPDAILDNVESGRADWGLAPQPYYFDPARGLARKYGVNRSRFYVKPGLSLRGYFLNTARPLFRNNVRLRRAVNFALDRPAIVRRGGRAATLSGHPADQYLPPGMPGFSDAHIYPLTGPDLRRARALARGQTRSGKAVLYTIDAPPELVPAQIVKRNLRSIGLDVEIKALPPQAYFSRLANLPFDLAFINWIADYVDPYQFANVLFDGRFIGETNFTRFNLSGYNHLMRRVARLQGAARYRAYGRLDVKLARDAAPMAAVAFDNEATLVSQRAGCIVLRPSLDLTAVCLE